jgi:FtsP/CotA-like multicopper oxidase with cupredoxin domain
LKNWHFVPIRVHAANDDIFFELIAGIHATFGFADNNCVCESPRSGGAVLSRSALDASAFPTFRLCLFFFCFSRIHFVQQRHYIQAELVTWSYLQANHTLLEPTPTQREQIARDATHLGTTFRKAIYVEYTNDSFSERVERPAAEAHLGLLGPLLRAVEGDQLDIYFRNALPFAASLYIENWFHIGNESIVDPVPPNGGSRRFRWAKRDRTPATDRINYRGATPARSSDLNMYYSDVSVGHIDAGLIGAVITTQAEFATLDRRTLPRDVDVEFVLALQIVDEDESPLAAANYAEFATSRDTPLSAWHNLKWAINGRMYDSLQGLDGVRIGDRVRVHVTALGDGDDNMALDIGAGRRVVALTSGERTSFDFVASEAGGVRVCSVAGDQAERGMTAQIVVTNQTAPWYQAAPVADRVHVIDMCAQEERWSDAPTCVYRRCTNATKSVGVVGPLIRVHVNDEVRVALSNNCSIAVGLTFAGLVATGGDDSVRVAPGAQTTLVYRVPDDAAGTSFLYRPPQPTLCGRGGESSLVGVCIVEREDPNESTAEQEQTDDDYDDVVIGLIGEQVNGVASNNTDDDSILLALPARATVRLHSFAHCSHRVTHLSIDDVWIDPARTALGDGAVRSLSLAMPFDGVRRLRFGNVSALFETRTAPTATVAVARERDAIANAPLRRVAASLVFTAAEQWAASASFGGDDSIDMGGDSSGAVVVLRMLSDERLEVRVRNDNASGAVALTFGGCLERTTGIASDASPIDVRFSDGRPTDVHVAAGGERTLHFVLAASLRAAFDANLTFSSYACLDRGALLVVTRRGAERGAADLAPRDVDREMVLVATATDINGVDNARFRVSQFQRARWYVGSRGATRAIVWHGAAVSDSPLRADDVLAVPVGTARTVDMVPDDVGEVHVHAGAEAELVVAAQAAPLDGAARRLDGIDVSLFHRHWGAAHSAFWRHTANPVLAQLPPVDDVVTFLMRSSPSVGTRRRPLVSQLLSAYINFLLADMVEVGAAAPQCVGDVCLAASRTAPSVARSDAAWRAGAARAGGGDFDRAPLERDPLPALLNLQTHWIDGSQIYGTSVEANRRLRTLSGGLLSTNVTLWPLRFASIQAIAVADLFVREHNRRAAALAVAHSGWSDEQLFGGARRLVVAEMQRIAVDELLPSLIGDTLPTYEHEPDVRGDVSTTFALACAPALMLGGTPARVELLNANLASVYASANGGDAAGSADAATLSTDDVQRQSGECGALLGVWRRGAHARPVTCRWRRRSTRSVGDRFPSLRVGNESAARAQSAPVDAATEWILRGREALLPSFAQLLREPRRNGAGDDGRAGRPLRRTPTSPRWWSARSKAAAQRQRCSTSGRSWRDALEQLYPLGVEQLDAMVGLLVEPPETPLSSSVGPTLARCVRRQLQRTRAADRLWFENGVVGLDRCCRCAPERPARRRRCCGTYSCSTTSLRTRRPARAHAPARCGAGGPRGGARRRDALRGVDRTFTGGGARAVRSAFTPRPRTRARRCGTATRTATALCARGAVGPANRGFERVPLEVMQLRNSADGALFVNMSDADLISLIGAVGATTASRGGLAMVWRRGRTDIRRDDARGVGVPDARQAARCAGRRRQRVSARAHARRDSRQVPAAGLQRPRARGAARRALARRHARVGERLSERSVDAASAIVSTTPTFATCCRSRRRQSPARALDSRRRQVCVPPCAGRAARRSRRDDAAERRRAARRRGDARLGRALRRRQRAVSARFCARVSAHAREWRSRRRHAAGAAARGDRRARRRRRVAAGRRRRTRSRRTCSARRPSCRFSLCARRKRRRLCSRQSAGLDGRAWQSTTQPLPTLRVSFSDRRRQHPRAARDADRLVRRPRLWAARRPARRCAARLCDCGAQRRRHAGGARLVRASPTSCSRRPTSRSTAAARRGSTCAPSALQRPVALLAVARAPHRRQVGQRCAGDRAGRDAVCARQRVAERRRHRRTCWRRTTARSASSSHGVARAAPTSRRSRRVAARARRRRRAADGRHCARRVSAARWRC